MQLDIYVQPNAKKTGFCGEHGGRLKLKVASAPIDNAANDEVCRYLAEALSLKRSDISIISGSTSRMKRVEIKADITEKDIEKLKSR